MAPVAVRRPMIAVVKKNNVSCTDLLQPSPHIVAGLRLPVASVHRPHHDFGEASALRCPEKLRPPETVGRPDALRAFPGRLENSFIAAIQFVDDPSSTEEHQAAMPERMIPDGMISSSYL